MEEEAPPVAIPPEEGGRRKTRRNVIGPLRSGLLTKVGYSAEKKASTRRRALNKAVKKYGKLSTLRKVNAVAVLTKRRAPSTSKAFKSDVKFLQKKYFKK